MNSFITDRDDIFNYIKNNHFEGLCNLAKQFNDEDYDEVFLDYKKGMDSLIKLQDIWSKSLLNCNADYSVYASKYYLIESFYCWKMYSRRYLQLLKKYKSNNSTLFENVNNVLDLGCGCAFSTVALSSIFNESHIYATNLKDTLQYFIDKQVTSNFSDITIEDESQTFNFDSIDLIFASEFFEHLESPIEFIDKLINTYHPKIIIFANTFTQMAIGHFYEYSYEGNKYKGLDMSIKFNNFLRKAGYKKVNTGFFNSRPQIFMIDNTKTDKATKKLF